MRVEGRDGRDDVKHARAPLRALRQIAIEKEQNEERRKKNDKGINARLHRRPDSKRMQRHACGHPARMNSSEKSTRQLKGNFDRQGNAHDREQTRPENRAVNFSPQTQQQKIERGLKLKMKRLRERTAQAIARCVQRISLVAPDIEIQGKRQRDRQIQEHEHRDEPAFEGINQPLHFSCLKSRMSPRWSSYRIL